MPKLGGPLFSVTAQGDLASVLNYHRRPGGAAVAIHHQPGSVVKKHAKPTTAQILIRAYYWDAVSHWKLLTEAQKQLWRDYVI